MGDPRHDLGRAAEDAVAAWLEENGWRVLGQRVRAAHGGELDLVALDCADVIVGIEVRARRTARAGTGIESIDARRLARMTRTLASFAASAARGHRGLRLDVVTVAPERGNVNGWRLRRTPDVGAP